MSGAKTEGNTPRPRRVSRTTLLAGLAGLVAAGVGLHLITGCFAFDDPCTGDAGELLCDPVDEFAGREVVANWLAEPGDVTLCPYADHKFEVGQDSVEVAYQGYHFVFSCSGECIEEVEADPGSYLDHLVADAGGPASDPDPAEGGAID